LFKFSVGPDYSKEEMMLRKFDMNMAYGPCFGMTRVERYERAVKFGLNPPREVGLLLKVSNVDQECLLNDRL
jgi:DNA polymerase delta subunit 4